MGVGGDWGELRGRKASEFICQLSASLVTFFSLKKRSQPLHLLSLNLTVAPPQQRFLVGRRLPRLHCATTSCVTRARYCLINLHEQVAFIAE